MAVADLTVPVLRFLLHYDPESGVFTWRISRQGSGAKPGKIAGAIGKNGYIYIGVERARWLAHRLAFFYMTGSVPSLVDHVDGVKTNNRWSNLRAATRQMNAQNTRRPHRANSSGFLGVSWSSVNKANPWLAQIKPSGKSTKNLGFFATPEEAHAAYLEAKRRLHEGCTI